MRKTLDQLLYAVTVSVALIACALFVDLGLALLDLKYFGFAALYLAVAIFGLLQWPRVMTSPKKAETETVVNQLFADHHTHLAYSEPAPVSWERPRV